MKREYFNLFEEIQIFGVFVSIHYHHVKYRDTFPSVSLLRDNEYLHHPLYYIKKRLS